MKIKVNSEKQTVSLKGLNPTQFALIEQLLSHVRLGDNTNASEAAFEILTTIEQCEELGEIEHIDIEIGATTDGQTPGLDLWMDSPTLVVCENDSQYAEDDFDGGCGDCDECDDCDC